MKIIMTKTVQGSLDGLTVRELIEGEEYETVDSPRGVRLAHYHVKQGAALFAPEPVAIIEEAPVVVAPRTRKK